MRWAFLLAWAPVGVAYLMNVGRAIEGCALLPEAWQASRLAGLSFGVGAVLLLPMLKVQGLFGNLVLSAGKWDSLKMGILDSFKTIVAEWAHLEFLAVPVLASFWVGLSYRLARQRLRGTNATLTREALASRDRSFLAFSLLAAAAETVILAIREYGNENPSFLDNWQQALGLIRSLPQVVALGILIVGTSWVWRRTET